MSINRKHDFEFVKLCIEKEGYQVTSGNYLNNKSLLALICPEGHQIEKSWNQFQRGYRCKVCYYSTKVVAFHDNKKIFDLPGGWIDCSDSQLINLLRENKGVYEICCFSGKRYIGSTGGKDGFYGRWSDHLKALRKGIHHNPELQKEWIEYGESNFRFRILEFVPVKFTRYREQWWLDLYGAYISENGYNRSPSAFDNKGIKQRTECVAKMRLSKKGKPNPEAVERMRLSNLGRKMKPETIKKRVVSLTAGKRYDFIHKETGEIVSVSNLSQFCRERGLSQGSMSMVNTGKERQHKGWYKC